MGFGENLFFKKVFPEIFIELTLKLKEEQALLLFVWIYRTIFSPSKKNTP